jgi:pimeloyl-ACP methyl ester carboxylesterase
MFLLALRFAALLGFAVAVTGQAAAQSPQSLFADVNGVRLHYLVAGQGAPVVLLHGYAETSHMWLPLIAQLQKTRLVIAPDLRGFGASSKPSAGYSKAVMAQDVHALVRQLGFDNVAIVGHDIGLMVAYAYAAQYPAEVDRIALLDAFIPGVGDTTNLFLLKDLWHFHFYGKTPLALVDGRERIYFEHFWNDSQPIPHARFPRLIGSFMRQPMRSPVPCGQASRCFAPSSRTPSTSPASQGSN